MAAKTEKRFVLFECRAGEHHFFLTASEGVDKSAFVKAMEVCFKRFNAVTSDDLPRPFELVKMAESEDGQVAGTALFKLATPPIPFTR